MDAFGIFEGGGAKGLAHVGAVFAAQREFGVNFIGYAGTSAGAIVAALLAAGYKPEDLYNPNNEKRGILEKDFIDFFEKSVWEKLNEAYSDLKGLEGKGKIRTFWGAANYCFKYRSLINTDDNTLGIFDTQKFIIWIEELLKEKFPKVKGEDKVRFSHLDTPLKIISSDLEHNEVKIFSKEDTPSVQIAKAVAASISIPILFTPLKLKDPKKEKPLELVDGGLISNFPAWVFDKERKENQSFTPTFGFQLIKKPKPESDGSTTVKNKFIIEYFRKLFSCVLSGDQFLETREIEYLNLIKLPVSKDTFDFELNSGDKETLYDEGVTGSRDFFIRNVGPKDPDAVKALLKESHTSFFSMLNGIQSVEHLRVNIIMPIDEQKQWLRVLYNYGMEDDADDRLTFRTGSGASGQCWESHMPVPCDLESAKITFKDKWKMDKYQQAFVRQKLKSLLSVPIFNFRTHIKKNRPIENEIIGVMNFDSDDDIFHLFKKTKVIKKAEEIAATYGYIFTK